ncbi:MAG: GNAT family N-acetyltransferase [Deltaproteobacteria bacterium]|nr:GNAT family N-acetyltransferase [Deltaproteobacteria bacterium]
MRAEHSLEITIRPARIQDAQLISDMIHELARYERHPEDCRATGKTIEAQLFKQDPRPAECLIAELSGEPVGFALFFHNFSTWECAPGLYLEDLFVRPGHRGKGAGKALFKRIAVIAVQRGCKRLEFSVLDWNEPSIRFYQAQKARAMAEWTVYRIQSRDLQELAGIDEPGWSRNRR